MAMGYVAVSSARRVAMGAALGALALVGALLAPLPGAMAQPSVPAEPVDVTATPGDSQVTLAWTPGDDNGSTIIRYEYTYDENGVAVNVWYPVPNSNRHTTGYTVTGLTNGNTYRFYLRAVNLEGNGAVATAALLPSVPATTPDPPTGLTATPGNSQATLTWTPGFDGGSPILYYEIRYRAGSGPYNSWTIMVGSTGDTTSHIVAGLSNGVTYWFQVRAVNAIGPTPSEPYDAELEDDTTDPEDDMTEPEATDPEDDTTEPETTEPETTDPEDDTTEPETTEPEATDPEDDTTEPETDTAEPEPDTTEPDTTEPETDTAEPEPDPTEPETTEPEPDTTEPGSEPEPTTDEPAEPVVVPPDDGLFYSGVISGPTELPPYSWRVCF